MRGLFLPVPYNNMEAINKAQQLPTGGISKRIRAQAAGRSNRVYTLKYGIS